MVLIAEELSERDDAVLQALARVRVLTGAQLERLLFSDIAVASRGRTRRRVLGRLVDLGLVVTLERRIGGVRAGSAGLVYGLSGAGQKLAGRAVAGGSSPRPRTTATPSALFLAHALAVAEAYVATMEALRGVPGVALAGFDVEQNATWPTGRGPKDLLRPDALVVLTREEVSDVWWLEVDRDTESLPRIVRLLRRYLAFARSGQAGPRGVVPRMLLSVPSPDRLAGVQTEIARLPAPAAQLFAVCMESEVAALLVSEILDDGSPVREA